MAKKHPLPKRKKRFNVKVIKFVCGDCNAIMERWNEPYAPTEEHFYVRCPVCGMHIRVYDQTYHCIDENNRCYLETKWNKDLEWKKEFLKKEKNYWENKRKQQEDFDAFQKTMDDEYKKEMAEVKKDGEGKLS